MSTRPDISGPCVIVGNGPSVDVVTPEFWKQPGVAYIGTNRCLVLSAVQNIKWTAIVIRDNYRNMWAEKDDGCLYHTQCWIPCKSYKVGASHDRAVHCDEYVRQLPGFQLTQKFDNNREMGIMRNSSVVLMAMNFAWLCGSRDIRLIGVDYHSSAEGAQHAKMIEPWASKLMGKKGHYERAVPAGIERQFKNATKSIVEAGGTIINCSPGTKLQAVPCG